MIRATFTHVFGRTNGRIQAATRELEGLEALRGFAGEVLPLDADRLDEARVVIPFWQIAIHDAAFAELNDQAMAQWREWIDGWILQGVERGELRAGIDRAASAEALLTFLLGAQIVAVLDTRFNGPFQLLEQLEMQLRLLGAGSEPGTGI